MESSANEVMTKIVSTMREAARRTGEADCNAELITFRPVHESVGVFRVRPDDGVPSFEAVQYTKLGLGNWESTVSGTGTEVLTAQELGNITQRVYSAPCTLLGPGGLVRRAEEYPYFDFHITPVPKAAHTRPRLTPRLFALSPGDRLYCGTQFKGSYTLEGVESQHDVVFFATGTAETRHNVMVAQLLSAGHKGRIVSACCVRHRRDLAYLDVQRELERRFANYHYVALTTREPENLDHSHPDYIGKMYLQDYVTSGRLDEAMGGEIAPANTHVFICGNPEMIGVPRRAPGGGLEFPQPTGMVETLVGRGFVLGDSAEKANLHFEKYW